MAIPYCTVIDGAQWCTSVLVIFCYNHIFHTKVFNHTLRSPKQGIAISICHFIIANGMSLSVKSTLKSQIGDISDRCISASAQIKIRSQSKTLSFATDFNSHIEQVGFQIRERMV